MTKRSVSLTSVNTGNKNVMRFALSVIRRMLPGILTASAVVIGTPRTGSAQWSTTYEQFYMPGSFNWAFRNNYPSADRLFNAFDYGHAILYEKLYTRPTAPVSLLEENEYDFITKKLLVKPPHVPLEEAAIEVAYAKLAPEAKAMFDWAHLLHRQIYDVWSDERLAPTERDAQVAKLISYYKTRPDLAFSSVPKTMELMEGQYYSTAFRTKYPKFNGLIWAYHWLQVGLYEPLLTGKTQADRQTGILAAVARFKQMLQSPPDGMPRIMPMTAAVSPTFARRYPEASIIFDNLHSMHDVVSDILASPKVPQARKREEIMKAASRYRDGTSFAMTPAEWMEMAQMMGVQNMGGLAVGFLSELPKPTVARGAVHNAGAMAGMNHGATGGTAAGGGATMPGMDHSSMNMPATGSSGGGTSSSMNSMKGMDHSTMKMPGMTMPGTEVSSKAMMDLHMRMMADPVIRARMMADPEMRRMMGTMMPAGTSATTSHSHPTMKSKKPAARKSAASKAPAKKTSKPAAKKPVKKDPMAGMDHSKMKM
ncbi:MAG: hypothetical protein ABI681_04990 [Gemmatimonadales bacterium]